MPIDTTPTLDRIARNVRPSKRAECLRVTDAIGALCNSMESGDRIPTHTELMRRFGASERAVLNAIHDLQQRGVLVRRHGSGTFVASPLHSSPEASESHSASRTVIAIAKPDKSFFDLCMELLCQHIKDADLDLTCKLVSSERDIASIMASPEKAAGYILFNYSLAPLAKRLFDRGERVVLMSTPPIDTVPDVPSVHGDQEHGGYLSTKHMIQLGHRHLVVAHPGDDVRQQWRWNGIHRAVVEAGRSGVAIKLDILIMSHIDSWWTEPTNCSKYFRKDDAPTAIVAWNDFEATRLLSVLNRAGVKVPEEVSLIGYDALPSGEYAYPPLSTVDNGIHQQLSAAVRLLSQTKPPPSATTVVVIPTLAVRESTGPAKSAAVAL